LRDGSLEETCDHLRFWHAIGTDEKLRCYTSLQYKARSWSRPRRVIARIECSLRPDAKEPGYCRQEVDIRYVVTSLEGSPEHIYESVYCRRGQMENLIKLHKTQLASDRMSCHSATANQVRLVLHTAAFWLMHGVRAAIPATSTLAKAEFATIRERLVKIAARVIEHAARIRIQLPTSCPEGALFRAVAFRSVAIGSLSGGAVAPSSRRMRQINPKRVARRVGSHRPGRGTATHARHQGCETGQHGA